MAVHRSFQIHYRFKDKRQSFFQPDLNMTDGDAWYYACLHAGIGVLHNLSDVRDELSALIRHAQRAGLQAVHWEEMPS